MPTADQPATTLGRRIYDAGWAQGSILHPDFSARIRPSEISGNFTHAIIVSQNCTIVRDDKEPVIELAWGFQPPESSNYNGYAHGRNPREYLVSALNTEQFIFDVRRKSTIAREPFITEQPLTRLNDDKTKKFAVWLGRRYSRPAFPDAFNNSMEKAKRRINKVLKSAEFECVTGVYYAVSPDLRSQPASGAQNFNLDIIFCLAYTPDGKPLPGTQRRIEEYIAAVKTCEPDGIQLRRAIPLTENNFPIELLNTFVPCDFDSFSRDDLEENPSAE